jgi:hypothetical protein
MDNFFFHFVYQMVLFWELHFLTNFMILGIGWVNFHQHHWIVIWTLQMSAKIQQCRSVAPHFSVIVMLFMSLIRFHGFLFSLQLVFKFTFLKQKPQNRRSSSTTSLEHRYYHDVRTYFCQLAYGAYCAYFSLHADSPNWIKPLGHSRAKQV